MLQIKLLKKPFFYIAAGLATRAVIKEDFQVRGNPSNRYFQSNKFEVGLLGSVGVRMEKWNAEVRFENSSGVGSWAVGAGTSRLLFLIKYRLLN